MIKLALTKGRIEQKAVNILEACGYDVSELREKGRKLLFHCPYTGENASSEDCLQIVLAKAADVITYVEHGTCDAGFVGRDTIMEMGGDFYELLDLGFGKCRFALAGIKGKDFYAGYGHKVIATKYPNVTAKYFASKGVECEIIKIEGSVELAPILGLSDGIIDIVETGATLKENGLEVYEDVVSISARCIVNNASLKLNNKDINIFLDRVSSKLTED